jgi:hypothetical protein
MNVQVYLFGKNQGKYQLPLDAGSPLPEVNDEIAFPSSNQTVYTVRKRQYDFVDSDTLNVYLFVDDDL